MIRVKSFFLAIARLKFKKYIITAIIGVLLVGFLGESSVVAHLRKSAIIDRLRQELATEEARYDRQQKQIYLLKTSPEAVERRARELYFLHTADEDVFVLSDDIAEAR